MLERSLVLGVENAATFFVFNCKNVPKEVFYKDQDIDPFTSM